MSQHPTLKARLLESVSLSSQTKHLLFEVEPAPFDFIAGQFVSMKALHDGREITRAYSIASAPRDQRTFDICLNRVPNGFFSNYLCDLETGALVHFHGPHGYFVLKNPVRDAVFIATGTGIAPMRGRLDWLFAAAARHEGREFWLVFGTRYAEDLYYNDQFLDMERKRPDFHYVSTLSRDNEGWTSGPRLRPGARCQDRRGAHGHGRLHLRPARHGASQPRHAQGHWLGPQNRSSSSASTNMRRVLRYY